VHHGCDVIQYTAGSLKCLLSVTLHAVFLFVGSSGKHIACCSGNCTDGNTLDDGAHFHILTLLAGEHQILEQHTLLQ